jgi:hypothetical protein
MRQILAKRLVDLPKDRSRQTAAFGEDLAHPNNLTALTGKDECAHRPPPVRWRD